ncbi:hypothetical protein AB0C34_16920 [Nocardia sp. NPDC049220]|uniref:hypothetical protein n=1 Tax=Nocardia sp. NPDC049220 TaxID=3155273 RepID=UPI00340D8872
MSIPEEKGREQVRTTIRVLQAMNAEWGSDANVVARATESGPLTIRNKGKAKGNEMNSLEWLHEGTAVTIVRERASGIEYLPAVVHGLKPELTWAQVIARADRGGFWSFNLTDAGVVGAIGGLDAVGFRTHLEPHKHQQHQEKRENHDGTE